MVAATRKVHADASLHPPDQTKVQAYAQLLASASALVADQRNWVANLANAASLLWHMYASLGRPSSAVNWAGFYVLEPPSSSSSSDDPSSITSAVPKGERRLVLGPFMGRPACQLIRFGHGVCGTAAATATIQVVPDVSRFPGHIACDGASASEIVVPILSARGHVVAIIDVDCTERNGFDDEDMIGLEALARLLAEACDFNV